MNKTRILVMDDEAPVRALVSRVLSEAGCQVTTAEDGREGLELAGRSSFDLVLLDLAMPEVDGWEVLSKLRADRRSASTAVILLTGDGRPQSEVDGLDRGADDFIAKPFALAELKARVLSVLRRQKRDVSANPLTRLPGSPVIEEEVSRRLHEERPFAFMYADIDDFKAFNDAYGFGHGDRAILVTADVLGRAVEDAGDRAALVGHVGGDDFVVVASPAAMPEIAQRAARGFDLRVPELYQRQDLSRGGLTVRDRVGIERFFPVMTLSMGVVSTEKRLLLHYGEVVQLASEMKSFVKRQPKTGVSRFAFDRRTR